MYNIERKGDTKMQSITFDELLAGALLKFKQIDNIDLLLLIRNLKECNIELSNQKENKILPFIIKKNVHFVLTDSLTLESKILLEDCLEAKKELMKITTPIVLQYLESMNPVFFTLEKINLLGSIKIENLATIFSEEELSSINKLKKNNYVANVVSNNQEELILTEEGKLFIFEDKNKHDVAKFMEYLELLGYPAEIAYQFLKTRDLDAYQITNESISEFMLYFNSLDQSVIRN